MKGIALYQLLELSAIVTWFRPPATSLNRVAPSVLKMHLRRIMAFSLKIKCAQGKTEKSCPPRGWYHVGTKLTSASPSGCKRALMYARFLRSWRSAQTRRSRRQNPRALVSESRRGKFFAPLRKRWLDNLFSNINPHDSLGSVPGHSIASVPCPHPKSTATFRQSC